jgi:hypothetical protein
MGNKMAYEKRPNSGSVFKNNRRRNDNDPAYTGDCLIDGKEFWINCWPKKDKNGDTWLSFSFNEKKPRQQEEQPYEAPARDTDDDSIPF